MKTAGLVVLIVGLLVGVIAAFLPFKETAINGSSYDCGPPLLRVASQQQVENDGLQGLIDRCEERAMPRLAIAGGAVLIGVVVGGGLLLLANRGPEEDI